MAKKPIDNSFFEDIDNFFWERSSGLDLSKLSKQYRKLENELLQVERNLIEKFPDQETAKSEINNYSDVYSGLEGEAIRLSYRKGFSDGIRFILESLTFCQGPIEQGK